MLVHCIYGWVVYRGTTMNEENELRARLDKNYEKIIIVLLHIKLKIICRILLTLCI